MIFEVIFNLVFKKCLKKLSTQPLFLLFSTILKGTIKQLLLKLYIMINFYNSQHNLYSLNSDRLP